MRGCSARTPAPASFHLLVEVDCTASRVLTWRSTPRRRALLCGRSGGGRSRGKGVLGVERRGVDDLCAGRFSRSERLALQRGRGEIENRDRTLSTTFPKIPSAPLTSSPPFFALHSANSQGGSREAANARPSSSDTVRLNSLSTLFPTIILTTSLLAGPVPANVSSSLIHDARESNVSRAVMS